MVHGLDNKDDPVAPSTGGLRRVLKSKREIENARAALDKLAYRLREGGPAMTRPQIRELVEYAAEQINMVAPRSIVRGENAVQE